MSTTTAIYRPQVSSYDVTSGFGLMDGSKAYARYCDRSHEVCTRAVTDASGNAIEGTDYYPFGLVMSGRQITSGDPAKEGFTSKERDAETGLDYFGARFYMPSLGRWNGIDPLSDRYPSHSPYNYVMNNPLSLVDPDGKEVSKEKDIKAKGSSRKKEQITKIREKVNLSPTGRKLEEKIENLSTKMEVTVTISLEAVPDRPDGTKRLGVTKGRGRYNPRTNGIDITGVNIFLDEENTLNNSQKLYGVLVHEYEHTIEILENIDDYLEERSTEDGHKNTERRAERVRRKVEKEVEPVILLPAPANSAFQN